MSSCVAYSQIQSALMQVPTVCQIFLWVTVTQQLGWYTWLQEVSRGGSWISKHRKGLRRCPGRPWLFHPDTAQAICSLGQLGSGQLGRWLENYFLEKANNGKCGLLGGKGGEESGAKGRVWFSVRSLPSCLSFFNLLWLRTKHFLYVEQTLCPQQFLGKPLSKLLLAVTLQHNGRGRALCPEHFPA